jgi:hypothetical protein
MLVKYSCGCIGFPPEPEGKSLLLRVCDSPKSPYGTNYRDMEGKSHEPLGVEEVKGRLSTLSDLADDGYQYRELRNVVRVLLK